MWYQFRPTKELETKGIRLTSRRGWRYRSAMGEARDRAPLNLYTLKRGLKKTPPSGPTGSCMFVQYFRQGETGL